jgi:putative phosphonate catabolism associated alcohol dehydrogenase
MKSILPETVKAAVYVAPGEPMRLREFALPELKGSEVLVRVRCTTICGSDLHTFFGRRISPAPSVLGHEMVGDVAAIGPEGACDVDGRPLEAGDRVTWSMVWSCGECFYCTHGLPPKCERLLKFGHEALRPGLALLGGFAEFCFLPERTAICRVPALVPDEAASPANCATSTVAAVVRHAGALAGANVVVYGAGMLGLTACAMANWRGAAQVIAVETDPRRLALARQFGATQVLDGRAGKAELSRAVRQLTAGRGAEYVLEFTGVPEAMEAGVELLRYGGRFLMAGATFPSRPIALDAEQLVRRIIGVQGVYNYEAQDLQAALHFLAEASGRFPFAELVGRSFRLEEIQEAFDYAERAKPPRVALRPFGLC